MTQKGFMNLPLALGMGILGGLRPSRAPQNFFTSIGPGLAQGLQMYAASQPKPQSELEKLRIAQVQAQMDASKAAAAQAAKRKVFFDKWVENQPEDMRAFYRANPDKAGQAFLDSRKAKEEKLYKVVDPKTGQVRVLKSSEINAGNYVNKLPKAKDDPNSIKGTGLPNQMFNAFTRAYELERKGEKIPPQLADNIIQLANDYTQPRTRINQQTQTAETYRPQLSYRAAQLVEKLKKEYGIQEPSAGAARDGTSIKKIGLTEAEKKAKVIKSRIQESIKMLKSGSARAGAVGLLELFRDNVSQQAKEIFGFRPGKVTPTQKLNEYLGLLSLQAQELVSTDTRFTEGDYKRVANVIGSINLNDSSAVVQSKLQTVAKLVDEMMGRLDEPSTVTSETEEQEMQRLRQEIEAYEANLSEAARGI